MHRRVAAALVAALALGVASCGESSEPLTRAQVTNRIEAACRQASEQMQTAQERRGGGVADFYAAVLAGQETIAERLDGIEAPDELADTVDGLATDVRERADAIADAVDMPRAQQERALTALNTRLNTLSRDIEAAFRDLGVRGCT